MSDADTKKSTPMEIQYAQLKGAHPDKLLLFRLGDFYELFGEDAEHASTLLGIALTKRHTTPMAGFPHHALMQYLPKLLDAGEKVALCEQVEDPKLAKGLVKRQITQVFTPGMLLDAALLGHHAHNFLAFLDRSLAEGFFVCVDISTGEVFALRFPWEERYLMMPSLLLRFEPKECHIAPGLWQDTVLTRQIQGAVHSMTSMQEGSHTARIRANAYMQRCLVPEMQPLLESLFGFLEESCYDALMLQDVEWMHSAEHQSMQLDAFTIRNLELVRNLRTGTREHTLLQLLDRTCTPMGARYLRRCLLAPLKELSGIQRRLGYTQALVSQRKYCHQLREPLCGMRDLERMATRILMKRILPRELRMLAQSLQQSDALRELLTQAPFVEIQGVMPVFREMQARIQQVLQEEPTNVFGTGVIRAGVSHDLDEYRSLLKDGKAGLLEIEQREREATQLSTLKIAYNKVFGYYIELSRVQSASLPEYYQRKQTLVNVERFTIPELMEFEQKILTADERITQLEEILYDQLLESLLPCLPDIQAAAKSIAEIDLYVSFAVQALDASYVCPVMHEGFDWEVEGGRHPVVEAQLGMGGFVPNTLRFTEERAIHVVTGPNMAGKSTYLRQNALIAIMAQIGSFVPADQAHLSVVDRVFTRIGASDDLSQGRSTFLVEMEEAAFILKQASPASLIVMDELGRGTSTYDGLSIVWAVLRYLLETPSKRAKTLLATHYHELTHLGVQAGVVNTQVVVEEGADGQIAFLYRVVDGAATQSYGIHVAQMAGMPIEVLETALEILAQLETRAWDTQTPAFSSASATSASGTFLERELQNLNIHAMTPLQALQLLEDWQTRLRARPSA